jgi:transposase-like protein
LEEANWRVNLMSVIDHKQIIDRYNSGKTVHTIAKELEVHPQSVYNVLRREGIPLRKESRGKAVKTTKPPVPEPQVIAKVPVESMADIDKSILAALTLLALLLTKWLTKAEAKK